ITQHGYAKRLEELHRRGHVEERLRPGADDEGLGAGELAEVARDVQALAAVDAADSAGAHEADARRAAGRERPAHGRRADRALHHTGGQVAGADLARVRGEPLEL